MNARHFDHYLSFWAGLCAFNESPARPAPHRKAARAKSALRKLLRRPASR